MRARQIDPRDTAWQVDSPAYRVYFWQRQHDGWASDEWELEAEDVTEALSWAEANSGGRAFVLYASIPGGDGGVGLVTLLGADPTGG